MNTPDSLSPVESIPSMPPRRKRQKTRAFEIPITPRPASFRRPLSVAMPGRGVKLSTIPNIKYAINQCHVNDPALQFLHRLLFNWPGPAHKRKTNLRSFSGFVFSDDADRDRVICKLRRAPIKILTRICTMLDLAVADEGAAGAAGAVVERDDMEGAVLQFLQVPFRAQGRVSAARRDAEKKAARARRRAELAKRAAADRGEGRQKAKDDDDKDVVLVVASDEDGDEDLETGGKTWIVVAKERLKLERLIGMHDSSSEDL